jgi:hypothetical protein
MTRTREQNARRMRETRARETPEQTAIRNEQNRRRMAEYRARTALRVTPCPAVPVGGSGRIIPA